MVVADYPFLDLMWTMFVFFGWVIWLTVLMMVLFDNFHRDDQSGWAKAGWTVFVIFLPVIGVLVYIVVRPRTSTPAIGM
jgi:heme/copper-type cytochrome/quinol oxidase subunit 2